jgi:hypothetical protein
MVYFGNDRMTSMYFQMNMLGSYSFDPIGVLKKKIYDIRNIYGVKMVKHYKLKYIVRIVRIVHMYVNGYTRFISPRCFLMI